MAAVTKLGLFLIVLISGIHGEENFYHIKVKGAVYTFNPPKEANFCVISRSIGEENLVLWNTSDPSPENPTLPEDLKKRLEVSDKKNISSYKILNLTHSDSGLYREECWTDGNVTHQWNTSITVCNIKDKYTRAQPPVRRTVNIPCRREKVGDNLTVQWFRLEHYQLWTRIFMDDNRSLNPLMKHLEGKVQLVNSSSLRISNLTRGDYRYYNCLVMKKQQCVSSESKDVFPHTEYIFHSVGEEAVLPCFDTDFYGPPAHWETDYGRKLFLAPSSQNHSEGFSNLTDREQQYRDDPVINDNFSLVFSSLTLNHSNIYDCVNDEYIRSHFLHVCPESDPLTQFFSEGERVTLNCNSDKTELSSIQIIWLRENEGVKCVIYHHILFFLIKSHFQLCEVFKDRLNVSSRGATIVLSNLSTEDSGEYWCIVQDSVNRFCKSSAKTILIYKHPFGIDSTFYAVWASLMSCGLLGMVCAVVTVNVILKTRRGEQVPVI